MVRQFKTPALALILVMLSGGRASADSMPPHPRLLFNATGIDELKQRVSQPPWADQWKDFKSRFDRTIDEKIELPPRGGNWWHWYVCPKHGVRLTQGKSIGPWQWEHICPVDKEVLHGDPTRPDRDYDGVIISGLHDKYARWIRDAGILYQVTGDARYARRGRDMLLTYAERYLSYPLHNIHGEAKVGGGRVGPQTLDESSWLIPVAQGTDLIWNTLSEADRQTLADKLFLPAARDVILPHKMGVHNIQCWKNSAVGLVGFLLGDQNLIHAAIDDKDRGFRVQMAKGVQADGVWHEGAWGYHFFTLSALWPLTEAARNCGIDLYGEPLKKMFEAPINLAMPNLMLPAFNDSNEVDVHNALYELAYTRYRDPLYLTAVAGSKRRSEIALLFGVADLPEAQPVTMHSRNAPSSGYAILQGGQGGQPTWLCLKYGPHGGGHGHPDKNNFILYAHGQVVCPDPGTRPYGSPLHAEWDKVTLAHNTLVVDETSQTPATGKCLGFGSGSGVDYAMTDAGDIYKGVRFIRTTAMFDTNLIVFVDEVEADQPHTFDLACHLNGRWQVLPAGEKFVTPAKDGYQHLRDATVRPSKKGLTLGLDVKDGWHSAIVLAGNEPTEVITATGVGKSTEDRVPLGIFRRKDRHTCYVWAICLDGTPVTLRVRPTVGEERSVGVAISGAQWKWQLTVDSEKPFVGIRVGNESQ